MASAPYEINESCVCGSTFNITGSNYNVMAKALREFRGDHDHEGNLKAQAKKK